MRRKTITISEDVYEILKPHKNDDESWSDFLRRLHEAVYTEANEGEHTVNTAHALPDTDDTNLVGLFENVQDDLSVLQDQLDDVLTEDHIDDVASITSNRTATEVVNRMTQP